MINDKPEGQEIETDYLADDLYSDFEYSDKQINHIELPDKIWYEEIFDTI